MNKIELTNMDSIEVYFHCGLCLAEKPKDQSPMEYQRIQCGWTELGLQVWCVRHDCNIIHIDFEGVKHPANSTRHIKTESIATESTDSVITYHKKYHLNRMGKLNIDAKGNSCLICEQIRNE